MKTRILIIVVFCFTTLNVFSEINVSAYFDKYWSKWQQSSANVKIQGNYDGFIIYDASEGPWEYYFKFTIDNMNFPDKKQRKKDIKANHYYQFTGTVEYYVSNNYPTALSLFRKGKGPFFCSKTLSTGLPAKKITSRATIKIAAFKDLPKTYNIWYDNVCFAIDLGTTYFPNVKFP